MTRLLTLGSHFQGIAGIGQGGHLGGILAEELGTVTRVRYIAPIPLERSLTITRNDEAIVVWDGDGEIAAATVSQVESEPPERVSWREAEEGRRWAEARFPEGVRTCFSCGSGPRSFAVHAGAMRDRSAYASPFTPPPWTAADDGLVRPRYLWAPLDCASGWRISLEDGRRPAVTGWLTVEIHEAVRPGTPMVVVADAAPEWQGRKRPARSALYTTDGTLVARSDSLWISLQSSDRT